MRLNNTFKVTIVAILVIAMALALSGCASPTPTTTPGTTITPTPSAPVKLTLATTTSVDDTGLLAYLKSDFDSKYNANLVWTAVGSGQAIALGKSGDADVLIVHSPKDETAFMNDGYGANRTQFAHNFYVIVGPANDPAGIKNMTNASQAFDKIRKSESSFISRGDASGTNAKELTLWNMTGYTPSNVTDKDWYKATGRGMGATLITANEMQAYTLSDISTFIHNQKNVTLTLLVENDPRNLINNYDIITLNQTRFPDKNHVGALDLVEYLTSHDTQVKISEFGVKEYGKPLFYADLLNATT
ncbi:MAG: substrate-binding domain-containing protein [Methanocella sp.]